MLSGLAVLEQRAAALDQRLSVKKRHQQALLALGDDLGHRRRVAGHNGRAHAHGLHQAPAQHKRVSQVHMHSADLHERQVVLVGDATHKMHTLPVGIGDAWPHLADEQVLPVAPLGRA